MSLRLSSMSFLSLFQEYNEISHALLNNLNFSPAFLIIILQYTNQKKFKQ